MPRKTPQQKKHESYRKDRRNTYGENSKSSRKNIRRAKRRVNRVNRRTEHQALDGAPSASEAVNRFDVQVAGKRPKSWSKSPDATLQEVVAQKLRRREQLGIDSPESVSGKLKRMNRHRPQ